MIGAPFQAKRLGYGFACMEQFPRHGVAFPKRLAQANLRFAPGAFVRRRQAVGSLVDEADDSLVAGKLLPIDWIVFVGVDDQRSIRALPRLGKIGSIGGGCAEKCNAKSDQSYADKTIDRLEHYSGVPLLLNAILDNLHSKEDFSLRATNNFPPINRLSPVSGVGIKYKRIGCGRDRQRALGSASVEV